MLGALGLEPDEEFVYRALLGRPSATAMLLADLLDRPEVEVEKVLSRLVECGLAIRSGGEAFAAAGRSHFRPHHGERGPRPRFAALAVGHLDRLLDRHAGIQLARIHAATSAPKLRNRYGFKSAS